jgi:hypothetical protein
VLAADGAPKAETVTGSAVRSDSPLGVPVSQIVALAFVAWVILATALGRSHTAIGLAGNDAHLFAYIGQKWFAGRLPYRDVWDNKPPGIFLATGLAFAASARGFVVLAVVEGLLVLGSIATVHAILRRMRAPRQVVSLAVALCAIMANLHDYNEGGTLTELYVLLPASLGILSFLVALAPLADDDARPTRLAGLAVAAGVFGGIATAFKLVGATSLLAEAGVMTLGWAFGRYRLPRVTLALAGVVAGFCVAWLPWLLYFHGKGLAGAMLWASFAAPLYYGAHNQPGLLHLPIVLVGRLGTVAGPVVAVAAGVAVGVRAILRGRGAVLTRARTLWVDGSGTLLGLWFSFDLLAALAGGRSYPHYFLTLSTSLSLAAALAYWRVAERPLAASPDRGRVLVLVGALICSRGLVAQIGDARALRTALQSPAPGEPVADYVNRHSRGGETLFSWPYHPQLFFATGLDSPHRLTSAMNLRDSPRMRALVEEDLLHTLETRAPTFLVDVGDNARARVAETSPLAPAHARFRRLLAARYDLVLASGDALLYRLRPAAGP